MNSTNNGSRQGSDTGYCGLVVGQHVVLVDDNWPPRKYSAHIKRPIKNIVYTVREIKIALSGELGGFAPGIWLEEIINAKFYLLGEQGPYMGEPLFMAFRFRPLQKLTTEQFMQTDTPVEGREVVA